MTKRLLIPLFLSLSLIIIGCGKVEIQNQVSNQTGNLEKQVVSSGTGKDKGLIETNNETGIKVSSGDVSVMSGKRQTIKNEEFMSGGIDLGNKYYKLNNKIYFKGKILEFIDIKSFQVLDCISDMGIEIGCYTKDKNGLYLDNKRIYGVSSESFEGKNKIFLNQDKTSYQYFIGNNQEFFKIKSVNLLKKIIKVESKEKDGSIYNSIIQTDKGFFNYNFQNIFIFDNQVHQIFIFHKNNKENLDKIITKPSFIDNLEPEIYTNEEKNITQIKKYYILLNEGNLKDAYNIKISNDTYENFEKQYKDFKGKFIINSINPINFDNNYKDIDSQIFTFAEGEKRFASYITIGNDKYLSIQSLQDGKIKTYKTYYVDKDGYILDKDYLILFNYGGCFMYCKMGFIKGNFSQITSLYDNIKYHFKDSVTGLEIIEPEIELINSGSTGVF